MCFSLKNTFQRYFVFANKQKVKFSDKKRKSHSYNMTQVTFVQFIVRYWSYIFVFNDTACYARVQGSIPVLDIQVLKKLKILKNLNQNFEDLIL